MDNQDHLVHKDKGVNAEKQEPRDSRGPRDPKDREENLDQVEETGHRAREDNQEPLELR